MIQESINAFYKSYNTVLVQIMAIKINAVIFHNMYDPLGLKPPGLYNQRITALYNVYQVYELSWLVCHQLCHGLT